MTVTLDLPSALESKLSREAAQRGVTLPEHLLGILAGGEQVSSSSGSGAEVVAYWRREGLVGTREGECDSLAHARTLRAQAERRERS